MTRRFLLTVGGDSAALAIAAALASLSWPDVAPAPQSALLLFGISTLVLCCGFRLYAPAAITRPERAITVIPAATALASLVFVLPVPGPDVLTVPQTAAVWLLSTGALALGRLGTSRLGLLGATAGESTLIIGAGRVGRIVEQRLRREPDLGLNPVGFLDDDPLYARGNGTEAPVLGGIAELERVLHDFQIQQVLIAFSRASDDELVKLVWKCERLGVAVAVVPRLFELAVRSRHIRYLGCISLVGIRPSTPTRLQVCAKDLFDRAAGVLLLAVFAPLLLLAAAAVVVSLGRPVFFRQRRVGRDGKTFEMLKLRTMRDVPVTGDGAEESYRCTRVGAFLRRTSLDELPQLFNILRGQMSFVGPRPERPEMVADFRRRVYRYDDRHRVKGGISGWAQIHGIGRGEDRFSPGVLFDRAEWDNFYIEHWSPLLELRILMRTFSAICQFGQGSSAVGAAQAPDSAPEEGSGAEATVQPPLAPAEFWLDMVPAGDLSTVSGDAIAPAGLGAADGSVQP